MGLFDLGSGGQTQTSWTGLNPAQKGPVSQQLGTDIANLQPYATSILQRQAPQLGMFNMVPGMDTAMGQLAKYGFADASAAAAMSGRSRPENFNAVMGSALQNISPQLMNLGTQNYWQGFNVPYQNLASYGSSYMNPVASALGSYSTGTGTQNQMGFGSNFLSGGIGGMFGQGVLPGLSSLGSSLGGLFGSAASSAPFTMASNPSVWGGLGALAPLTIG